ncbi:Spectinomycin tetracycline efflux pump [Nocardia otitidiscaviarum]|uniref:Spectinomycin tetracycline efflux pump n=1 Tax=Nocardia otitidiscaviarum TaxID=1823 RepID=A0A379JHE6_9NOCA|nr:MFS transporter [Nocardia otitidiscaviarum]SUD47880.1 Spectinomycin tetracycline efflux pump [Nocardia otitidiscaviarum]
MVAETDSTLTSARGRLILLLLCAVQFLDIVDSSILNVALPSIRADLPFTAHGVQWVLSGYLLTYGGFLLLGGRLADLVGRRRMLAAGFVSMFFFLTLYMQNVLGFSPTQAGAAYLPVTVGMGIAAGVSAKLFERVGTRPVIVAGALIAAAAMFQLSRIPVGGDYRSDLLPGLLVVSIGLGAVFVAVTTAANAGVPADRAGLAAGLLNSSQQLGAAMGLAILTAIATSRTNELLAGAAAPPEAFTAGFQRALFVCGIFALAAAVLALRAGELRIGKNRSDIDAATPAVELKGLA